MAPALTGSVSGGSPLTLEQWLREHGPLDASQTLLLLLELCGHIDRLSDDDRSRSIDSLQVQSIVRSREGWRWNQATRTTSPFTTEADIVERLGLIAHFSLSGERIEYPIAGDTSVRGSLRRSRPDLPPNVIDLVVDCLTARRHRRMNLAGLARNAGALLGVDQPSSFRWSARALASASALVVLALAMTVAAMTGQSDPSSTGLTALETTLSDLQLEAAATAAVSEEHTAAIQRYQAIRQAWRTSMESTDPRLMSMQAHEAWVRTLAGDRLTTEQLLDGAPAALRASLGSGHPYVRTAMLALAVTVEARGLTSRANELRSEAAAETTALFGRLGTGVPDLEPWPVPSGVMAHVAPNRPEEEGFRLDAAATGYWQPWTSIAQWFAARDGWNLHVVASGNCRVSMPAGIDPRLLTVRTSKQTDGGWTVAIDGGRNAIELTTTRSASVAVSLSRRTDSEVDVTIEDSHLTLEIDATRAAAAPPYGLQLDDPAACALAWLEIPFPPNQTFRLR